MKVVGKLGNVGNSGEKGVVNTMKEMIHNCDAAISRRLCDSIPVEMHVTNIIVNIYFGANILLLCSLYVSVSRENKNYVWC